ncbi:PfkB family carbohydrate kinase [Vibrio splendidus]
MNKYQRVNAIRLNLLKNKKVYVSDLSISLSVSGRTIRRDLRELVESGIAELFFGGAKLIEINQRESFKNAGINKIMSTLSIKNKGDGFALDGLQNKLNNEVYILGSFNIDIVSEVESFPKVGETIHSLSTNFYAGGKGSNQATAAAKVSNNVHFSVKIGDDEFGEKAKNYLASTEIDSFTILKDNNHPTGNAVIIVEKGSGENVITIDLGANLKINKEELTNEFSLINDSNVFLTQLENNFEITKLAIEYASRSPALVMLNPAPYSEDIKQIIHLVDIVTPNETEAESLTGIEIKDLDSAKIAAEKIYGMGVKAVVLTLGSKGSLLFDGKTHQFFEPFKAVVTDTSGAGDSFNGALAANIAQGKSLEYSMKYASAFASLAVERKGASNMPNAELVEARLTIKG